MKKCFVLSQQTLHPALLFESVMSVVWSRQRAAQRTFGTTVSIAGLVSLVRSEGSTVRMSRTEGKFRCKSFSVTCFLYSRLMMWPVSSSIVIRATTFSHNGPEDDVVRQVFALLSKRVQVWVHSGRFNNFSKSSSLVEVCVRARILTSRHEDENMDDSNEGVPFSCALECKPVSSRDFCD